MATRRKGRSMRTSELTPERIAELLSSETHALETLLKKLKKPVIQLKLTTEQFVQRCFMLHRRLIGLWNGWSYTGSETLVEDQTYLTTLAFQEWETFRRQVSEAQVAKAMSAGLDLSSSFILPGSNYNLGPAQLLSSKTLHSKYPCGDMRQPLWESVYCNQDGYAMVPVIGVVRPATESERRLYGTSRRTEWIQAKMRTGQRISAAVMEALEESKSNVLAPLKPLFEKLFQRLGENVWTSTSIPIRCTLSCAPTSFMQLGEYGENSCYQNGGAHEYSKHWLAVDCPDSFVALFHRFAPKKGDDSTSQEAQEALGKLKVHGRAWGVACPKRGAFVSNFYLLPSPMVLPSLKVALTEGMQIANIHEVRPQPGSEGISSALYLNGDSVGLVSKSAAKQALFRQYLNTVITEARYYGYYGNRNLGPAFVRLAGNTWIVSAPPRSRSRNQALWPYKDAQLRDMLSQGIRDGIIRPHMD